MAHISPDDEPRAVFVDTNFDTHFAVSARPSSTVLQLQQLISLEHFNCFPKYGRILIKDLTVRVCGMDYQLPATMLLKSAFVGLDNSAWVVVAEAWTPGGSVEVRRHSSYIKLATQHYHDHKLDHTQPSIQHDYHHKLEHRQPSTQRDHCYKLEHILPSTQHDQHEHIEPPSQRGHNHKLELIQSSTQHDQHEHIEPSTQHDQHEHLELSTQHDQHEHIEPSTQHDPNHKCEHIEPSTQHDPNHKLEHIQPSIQDDHDHKLEHHDHKLEHIQPSIQHDHNHKLEYIQPSTQHDWHSKPSSVPHEIPDTSSKKKMKSKKKKDKGVDKVDNDLHPIMNLKENTENKNGVLKTGFQDRNIVQQKDYPLSDVKEQLDKNKRPVRPCVVHKLRAVVRGTPNIASPPGSGAKKSKNRRKNINVANKSDDAITNNGYAFPEKGDAPSDNDNTINRSVQKVIAAPAEVSRSQVNNVPEAMPQQVTSNLEKNIEEDLPLMKPDNNSKKSKACESKQESQNAAQKVLPSHLNNIPEPLAEGELLKSVEKVKEVEEAVVPSELENTSKKRMTKKAKSSSATQDLTSRMPNDSKITDGIQNICGEFLRPDDIGRSNENVETASVNLKNCPGSSVKQHLDEEIKEMASPISAIQSDKPNKKRQKKQLVPTENLSSMLGNQHSNETMMKMNAPKNVDDNDQECRKTADVASLSLPNDVSKGLVSQVEPSKLIGREKEIEDDVALFESDNMTENWRTVKERSSMENQLSSSGRHNQDETDGTKGTLVEVSALDHLDRPEGSVETMSGKSKRSRNLKAVPGKNLSRSAVQKQLDEEANDKSKKMTRKKRLASEIDFSSLPVDQQLDEKSMKMDSPKNVELADDCLRNCDIDGLKNKKKMIKGEGHQGGTSEIPSLEDSIDLADSKKADQPGAIKQKQKKLDQLTSVDTSSNGINLEESKKDTGSAKTSELHKSINRQKDLSVKDASNVPMEMNAQEKIDDSLTESSTSDDDINHNAVRHGKEHDESSPALGLEGSAVLDDARQNEKGQASKQKIRKVDQSSSIDTSSNEHNLGWSKKNRGIAKNEFQKSITDQKHNNNTPPLSARHSNVSSKVKDTLVSPDDLINTSGKTDVSSASSDDSSQSSEDSSRGGDSTVQKICKENKAKGPSNKLKEDIAARRRSSRLALKEVSNVSKEKKGGLASSRAIFDDENSSSSDEEGTDGSSSSTTLPPDDDSESESKGVVVSKHDSPKHDGSSKVKSSASKLESILRSSSTYKKAKFTASQSQDQDELPEFVPDSLADM